ncbi:hypothetical protein GCM10017744_102730 [Streptomyces antimycoticus]|uniref:DUF45 domain-containing protein n=1 Tax=Streptomyces antimycoticus TaxID=68175 RepID=A0A4D4KS70_9ACTN|nr:hypothetical protein [Streptomyces antimycoticus]GDY49307.1 hypothetical protein SANT12839_101890 [Streptomyces antimycoticus]
MLTISAEHIKPSQRRLVTHTRTIAPQAEQLVRGRFGALPSIHLGLFGDADRWAETTAQAELSLVPETANSIRYQHQQDVWKSRRKRAGITILASAGVAILINLRKLRTPRDINETLVHELTHGYQLGSTQAREEHAAYLRHCWNVAALPRREFKKYERLVNRHETEARNAEALASQLPT